MISEAKIDVIQFSLRVILFLTNQFWYLFKAEYFVTVYHMKVFSFRSCLSLLSYTS